MTPLSASELESLPKEYSDALKAIVDKLPDDLQKPIWGIVCGSGLATLVDQIEEKILIDYDTIPVSSKCKLSFL